jgi:hypothetical protein
MTKKREVTMKI